MKKNSFILGTVILCISLMAMKLNSSKTKPASNLEAAVYSDYNYSVGPRFDPIQKSKIKTMTSVNDFNTPEEKTQIVSYQEIALIVIKNERQTDIREFGNAPELNAAQLKLLQTFDVNSHFLMRTEFMKKNLESGELEFAHYGAHYTIVPEKQVVYEGGKDALISYISSGNKENTKGLDEKKLQWAMLYFTITETGTLINPYLDRTSGNVKIDKAMLELISNAPGKWIPAENEKGEKIAQELVVAFGVGGC